MTIAHDAATRWPATAGTTDLTTGTRTFTHTPAGTPAAAVVVVMHAGTAAIVTGVLYGGVAMTLTETGIDTGESRRVEVWTLIASVPSGAQTVTLQTASNRAKFCVCSTVTAASAVEINTSGQNFNASGSPSITLTTTKPANSYGGYVTGNATPGTVGTGCTNQADASFDVSTAGMCLRRTADAEAAGSIVLSGTTASDDNASAAVAFAEAVAAAVFVPQVTIL